MSRLAQFFRRFGAAQDGLAAIEMSLVAVFFSAALINAVEIGRYGMALMQVSNAAQAGVAAANHSCDVEHLPATQNCSSLYSAVGTAVQSTSLGNRVSVQGQISEGWYCINGTKTLQYMAPVTSKPADCTAANNTTGSPGLYLAVHATYLYQPIFPGLTIAETFVSPINRTAWARLL
jgi:Flp pilus assembly protein TadG